MKAAMKAGDKVRLGVIRLINAAIKQREVDERIELDDAAVLAGAGEDGQAAPRFDQPVRRRRHADLAGIERDEMAIIEHYLPAKLGEGAIRPRSTRPSPPPAPPARPTWAS